MSCESAESPLCDSSSRDIESCSFSSKSVNNDDVAVGKKVGQTGYTGTTYDKDKLTNSHHGCVDYCVIVCTNVAKQDLGFLERPNISFCSSSVSSVLCKSKH